MKMSTKKYVDSQIKWLEKLTKARFEGQEKAVEVYNENLDQWKKQHNEWKGQMSAITSKTLTRNEAWIFIMAAIGIALSIWLK